MLYTASYFQTTNHHGRLISVSRTIPKDFEIDGKLSFFAPQQDLLADWKEKKITPEIYQEQYRNQIKHCWEQVKAWLAKLDPNQDATLLCWEAKGKFCHRNLIAQLVRKHRPDCFGGCDILYLEPERCLKCNTKTYVGLDASFCPSCRVWIERYALERARTREI